MTETWLGIPLGGELPEQTLDAGSVLTHIGIDLAVGTFQPGGRDQCGAAMPGAGQVYRLLAGAA